MITLLKLLVVAVALVIAWLRFRKQLMPLDPDNWWLTILKPNKTDPDTPWFNLLRTIEGEEQPMAAPPQVFVQWISSDATSIFGTNGGAIATSNAASEVRSWKAQGTDDSHQFIIVQTKEGGKGTVTFNPIPIRRMAGMGLAPTTTINNRRAIHLPIDSYLILNSNTQLIGSTVFLVVQWNATANGVEEIMGQVRLNEPNHTVKSVLTSTQSNTAESYTFENTERTEKLGDSADTVNMSTVSGTTHNKISVLGLQIQPTNITFIDPAGALNTVSLVTRNAAAIPEGIHIGSKMSQNRSTRYIHEVRIYPSTLIEQGDMKSTWQGINALYNPPKRK